MPSDVVKPKLTHAEYMALLRAQYEKDGYVFDDGLELAFERAKTGANAHHFNTILSAYRNPGRWAITCSPDKHTLWQLRMRKMLNGMTDDQAHAWWLPEFEKLAGTA